MAHQAVERKLHTGAANLVAKAQADGADAKVVTLGGQVAVVVRHPGLSEAEVVLLEERPRKPHGSRRGE